LSGSEAVTGLAAGVHLAGDVRPDAGRGPCRFDQAGRDLGPLGRGAESLREACMDLPLDHGVEQIQLAVELLVVDIVLDEPDADRREAPPLGQTLHARKASKRGERIADAEERHREYDAHAAARQARGFVADRGQKFVEWRDKAHDTDRSRGPDLSR